MVIFDSLKINFFEPGASVPVGTGRASFGRTTDPPSQIVQRYIITKIIMVLKESTYTLKYMKNIFNITDKND